MAYNKINWTNTADTPLNAKNLNTMDTGIYNNEQSINTLEGLITYHNLTVDCFKDNNYRVTGGTKKTTENGCIQIEGTRTTTTLYRNLLDNKVIDNDRLMLIKLRIKRNNSSILLITFKYTTEDDEVYVIKDNIVASNLRTSSTIPSYTIEDDDYHDVWCIFKSSKAIQIKSIAVELSLTVDVTISNFQAFYSMDKVESSSITNAMEFISEIVNISDTDEYRLTAKGIANSSPVYISIKAKSNGSENTIVRSDKKDLIDVLTNKVVDSTMTDIQITAEDILAGIKATGAMSVQIRYYSANCEDLLQMIKNSGSREQIVNVVNEIIQDDKSTELTVEEVF